MKPASKLATVISTEQRYHWLRQMIEIRLFEERVQELFMTGSVPGTVHLSQGQEAVAVGATAALGPLDQMTMTHRCHAQALARGMNIDAAFAELMGRATGCCRGVGGSMHLADRRLGLLGAFAIVGAGLPVALGAAMSAKFRGDGGVAMTFCGDGAVGIGTFHETLNMASIWRAPIVFVVENNLYAEYTPMRQTAPSEDVADRACAYGIPGIIVDGQDVELVYESALQAVVRARAGEGPTLIEAKTYRYVGHSRSDPAHYRSRDELAAWKVRDPIDILSNRLTACGALAEGDLQILRATIQQQVDDSSTRAAAEPWATSADILHLALVE